MAWVVVSDPVPAGATLLGSGLGRDSAIATRGEQREGRAWLAYEERAPTPGAATTSGCRAAGTWWSTRCG